ncbi:hypothetical protein, partial [Gordonia aichiensis]
MLSAVRRPGHPRSRRRGRRLLPCRASSGGTESEARIHVTTAAPTFPRPGWVEQNAHELWVNVQKVVPKALALAGR